VNVVVVDDEPAIVKLCNNVLVAQGHRVHGFTTTSGALAHLGGGARVDLLVVDYQMPDLNGLEFIQRAWDLQPQLRVVMITAHGTRELLGEAAQAGIHGVVLKPFTAIDLARAVETTIGESSQA
jgi:DNA-binding NtrC family response regulator